MGVKKKWTPLMVCILVICMTFSVYAAERVKGDTKGSLLAGYVLNDKLYAFFEAGEQTEAELLIGDVMCAEGCTESLVDSGQYVHYYILLDASGSVKRSRYQIKRFVMNLMQETRTKKMVTIMTLGESFDEVIAASMEDDAVQKALDKIAYSDQKTNLYKGIDSAVQYIDEKERTRGDLCRLVLITDGEQDSETDIPSPDEVKKRVEARTDIIFDVIGVGNWKKGSEKNLPMSGREVNVVKSIEKAEDAAVRLAAETNGLYTVCFELSGKVQDHLQNIRIFLKGNEKRILEQQRLTVVGRETVIDTTEEPEEEPGSTGGAAEEESESTGSAAEEEPGSTGDAAEEESGSTGDATEGQSESTGDAAEEESGSTGGETQSEYERGFRNVGKGAEADYTGENTVLQKIIKKLPVYGGIALGGIVLCAAAVILLKRLLGREDKIAPGHLRVEVLSGKCISRKKDFLLEHTLFIGSGKQCDVIWKDPDVAGQNTRIFVHEGIVYIEDLHSPCGTMIGGMRIFAPNRLRSGDIVSIGDCVQFRIFFNQI